MLQSLLDVKHSKAPCVFCYALQLLQKPGYFNPLARANAVDILFRKAESNAVNPGLPCEKRKHILGILEYARAYLIGSFCSREYGFRLFSILNFPKRILHLVGWRGHVKTLQQILKLKFLEVSIGLFRVDIPKFCLIQLIWKIRVHIDCSQPLTHDRHIPVLF